MRPQKEGPLHDLSRIKSQIRRHLGGRLGDMADDYAMDMWIEIWTKQHCSPLKIDHDIIRNRCYDILREQYGRDGEKAQEVAIKRAEFEDVLQTRRRSHDSEQLASERKQLVALLMNGLSMDQKRLIYYRFWLGLTITQTCSRLDIAEVTYYQRKDKLFNILRERAESLNDVRI